MIEKLKPYLGKSQRTKDNNFSVNAREVMANYFIQDFFSNVCNYTLKPDGKEIGFYKMS